MPTSGGGGPPVPFSALPLVRSDTRDDPSTGSLRYNAWGAYGPDDQLGFLNRQTQETVAAAAAAEIKTGRRVLLDAPLDFPASLQHSHIHSHAHGHAHASGGASGGTTDGKTEENEEIGTKPLFNRQRFVKNVYQKKPRIVHDDTWTLNTQSSTQWDGLRHVGYQKAERFYNDVTVQDISGASGPDGGGGKEKTKDPNVLGIHNAARQGGITGRGVLVDFARWASQTAEGRQAVGSSGFKNFESVPIKLAWLKATLAYQGNTQPQFGDILLIRTGYFPAFEALTLPERDRLQNPPPSSPSPTLAGVEQSVEMLHWIWDHFSAVAGDQPSFERWPPPRWTHNYTDGSAADDGWSIHEVLIAGWGCNIGELFHLEELSRECERQNRWSFFFTSVPCHVPGGVASPPNAVAIF